MMTFRWTTSAVALAGLVAWLGCSRGADSSQLPPGASQGGEATPIEPSELDDQSDEQILAILTTLDQTELEHGQLALERAQSPQVREFAGWVVQRHGASQEEVARIAATNDMTSKAGSISRALHAEGSQSLQTLSAADATTFDQVYLKLAIDRHRQFLNLLNERLLQDVDNEALLHQMQATRDSAQEQLTRAEKLESQLKWAAKFAPLSMP